LVDVALVVADHSVMLPASPLAAAA
jgi:hypothetical protein